MRLNLINLDNQYKSLADGDLIDVTGISLQPRHIYFIADSLIDPFRVMPYDCFAVYDQGGSNVIAKRTYIPGVFDFCARLRLKEPRDAEYCAIRGLWNGAQILVHEMSAFFDAREMKQSLHMRVRVRIIKTILAKLNGEYIPWNGEDSYSQVDESLKKCLKRLLGCTDFAMPHEFKV